MLNRDNIEGAQDNFKKSLAIFKILDPESVTFLPIGDSPPVKDGFFLFKFPSSILGVKNPLGVVCSSGGFPSATDRVLSWWVLTVVHTKHCTDSHRNR